MIAAGRTTGKSMSIPGGLALSGVTSMCITLLFSLLLAKLLNDQKVSWDQVGYWIIVMLFTSAFLGAKAAITSIRRPRVVISVMSGTLYWALLLCITALFFGGNFDAVSETAMVIIAGSSCAAMVSLPQKKKRSIRSRKR